MIKFFSLYLSFSKRDDFILLTILESNNPDGLEAGNEVAVFFF